MMVAAVALLAVTCGGSGTNSATPTGSGSASPSGEPATPVTLTFWHGYTDVEADSLKALLDQWNGENPNIHIKPLFVNNDKALQKLTVALEGRGLADQAFVDECHDQAKRDMAALRQGVIGSEPRPVEELFQWVFQGELPAHLERQRREALGGPGGDHG